ncbi:hypothetical protein ROHU_009784 [Labeo rohita]|uniref:AIG1-type G domain-containing protein n=1 Tax=Labeo rohita TaxID=84645 RepID=A0A498LTE2_LABRO|nr:uncharacterized protein LOC127180581 [Labeo rohita]RXN10952.1 hypothetical protein ROHU_010723 [Labeo rohita]RXN13374.1 hypothetical protein ROHU_009784 [Labeo rohita]
MSLLQPQLDKIIKQSTKIANGPPTRYNLKPRIVSHDESKTYSKITFGERNKNKSHRVIIMVGETGTGKTTLLNTIVNYMLGVKREDKVWFEITDDQSDRTSAHSQTSRITVYGFYLQDSQIDLTIIDTPGYGDTRGIDLDKEISASLLSLSKSAEGVNEIHAVCLVIKATQNRLSERQIYIFDAVQSLFGRDIVENIVLLFTHSTGKAPKNALTAVKEAKIKCAVNDKNQPVYFLFDNCQSEAADDEDDDDEEGETIQNQSWNRSFRGTEKFFSFLDTIQPKSLQMTQDVLQKRKQLEANVSNLQSRVHEIELKQNELKEIQEALEKNKEYVKKNKNFEYEVNVPYKKRVNIDTSKASVAMCCTVCEENCHYPGCWKYTFFSWCEMFEAGYCTVCTNECHKDKHVKEDKIYVQKTKKVIKTYTDLKKKYDDMIGDGVFLVRKLTEELQEYEEKKIKLLNEAFDCVQTLQDIALNTDSVNTLLHSDFLIEKLKEIDEAEKATILENMKKAGEEKQGAVGYFKSFLKK